MGGGLARTTGSDMALAPGTGLWQDARSRGPRAFAFVLLDEYQQALAALPFGKRLPGAVFVHRGEGVSLGGGTGSAGGAGGDRVSD